MDALKRPPAEQYNKMTIENIKIRKAVETDFQSVDFLYQQNYKLYSKNISNDYKNPPIPTLPKGTFLNITEDKNALLLVAEIDEKVVGILYAIIEKDDGDDWTHPYNRVSVEEMSVSKDFSRQGVGTMLIENTQNWAKKKGINNLIVLVHAFNKNAINFYLKNDFRDYSIKMVKKIQEKTH